MIPLSARLKIRQGAGPERAARYNGFLSSDINTAAAPGYSSGQAQVAASVMRPVDSAARRSNSEGRDQRARLSVQNARAIKAPFTKAAISCSASAASASTSGAANFPCR
jgi:hypothetical protein